MLLTAHLLTVPSNTIGRSLVSELVFIISPFLAPSFADMQRSLAVILSLPFHRYQTRTTWSLALPVLGNVYTRVSCHAFALFPFFFY
jgi:hypothetical protein